MEVLDILDAVNARLLEKWPKRTVYVDVCPIDFERPSFWLAVEQFQQTNANRFMVRRDVRLKLTLYDEKDEHYESSWLRLDQEAQVAAALLTPPLYAAGRAITFTIKALPRDPDAAFLQLTASWLDQRASTAKPEPPVAEHYQVHVEMTNH